MIQLKMVDKMWTSKKFGFTWTHVVNHISKRWENKTTTRNWEHIKVIPYQLKWANWEYPLRILKYNSNISIHPHIIIKTCQKSHELRSQCMFLRYKLSYNGPIGSFLLVRPFWFNQSLGQELVVLHSTNLFTFGKILVHPLNQFGDLNKELYISVHKEQTFWHANWKINALTYKINFFQTSTPTPNMRYKLTTYEKYCIWKTTNSSPLLIVELYAI